MRKFLSILMVLAFLTGGTAWAKHKKSTSPDGATASRHHSKKKSAKGRKKKSKTARKAKRGSKSQSDVKANTDFSKSDVEIDLKGQ